MAVWKSLIFGLALMVAGEECDGNQLLQTQRRAVERRLPGLAPGKSALIVVDMQNDFITGSLPVGGGAEIIPVINNLTALDWDFLGYTEDYHPANHLSFASSSPFNKEPFEMVNVSYTSSFKICGSEYRTLYSDSAQSCTEAEHFVSFQQELWPQHCIQGTYGQKLHPELIVREKGFLLRKGYSEVADSYGAFFTNIGDALPKSASAFLQKESSENQLGALLQLQDIQNVVVLGLAEDYCVKYTSMQSLLLKYKTYLVTYATKPVFEAQGVDARRVIKEAGGHLIESCCLLGECACA